MCPPWSCTGSASVECHVMSEVYTEENIKSGSILLCKKTSSFFGCVQHQSPIFWIKPSFCLSLRLRCLKWKVIFDVYKCIQPVLFTREEKK